MSKESFKRVVVRKTKYGKGDYLVARVPTSGIDVYIYENEAGFGAPNEPKAWHIFEEWAFRTPYELIEYFVRACAEALGSNGQRPAQRGR